MNSVCAFVRIHECSWNEALHKPLKKHAFLQISGLLEKRAGIFVEIGIVAVVQKSHKLCVGCKDFDLLLISRM